MDQLLTVEAKTRLANIAVVKPEKAEKLENIIIQNAQRGVIQGKVSEQQFMDLLGQFGDVSQATEVKRAKHHFEDEDELDLDNLDL